MEFRWVALIALWTLVSGPMFGVPTGPANGSRQPDRQIVKPVVEKPFGR